MIELKPAINEVKLTLKSISRSVNLGTVVEPSGGGSVPTDVRQAIYTLLDNAAYATTGLEDEIAIVQAWAQEVTVLTLSTNSLELHGSTPQTIVPTVVPASAQVLWSSSDESIATVSNGVVTGVNNGSCVITATAGGKTANCAVTVTGFVTLESISAVYTQSGTVYDIDSLDSLKADLVVTATYSDTSTATIPSGSYSLSGTLTAGTSTITVTYQGKTTTFSVTVTSTLIYSLYNHTFANSNPVATGEYLLTSDRDITFAFDVDFAGQQSGTTWKLFAIINGSGNYEGLTIQAKTNTGTDANKTVIKNMTNEVYLSSPNLRSYVGNFKYIVTHTAGTGKWHYYYKIGSNNVVDEIVSSPFVNVIGQLTIGGTASASQVFNGTVNKAEVYSRVITAEEIATFMGG